MRFLAGLAVTLVSISLVLALGKQPRAFAEGSNSEALLAAGVHDVTQFNIELIDVSRPTQPNGEFAGSTERRFIATVWHPEIVDHREPEAGPLIVYSHGFSSNKMGGAYLAELLASIGYVVVATDYPLTHMGAPGGPLVQDVVNQPEDVSFLIDTLLAWSNDSGHTMAGLIDERRIGVTGISLGGLTSILASYHPSVGDPRIAAALAIAGPTQQFNARFYQTRPDLPFLMLAADVDAMVTYESNALNVLADIPGSQLVTVRGGSHTGFAGTAGALRWLNNPDSLGCYMVTRRLEGVEEESWHHLFGTPEQGINYDVISDLCLLDPLPETINPLRQQMITAAVTRSFFESSFAATEDERAAAALYLSSIMGEEIEEVEWQIARH